MVLNFRWLVVVAFSLIAGPALPQNSDAPVQLLLQTHGDLIAKGSRKSIGPAIDALAASGLPAAQMVLQRWQAKEMWRNKDTGLFVFGEKDGKDLRAFDVSDGEPVGTFEAKAFKQLKPNSGVRGMIGAALVQFQLSDPDPEQRRVALRAIERDPEAAHLVALRGALEGEADPELLTRKQRLERLLTIRFGDSDQ